MGLEMIGVLRKRLGISIEELSEKSGIPLGTLSKISAGITKDPKLETVKAIARALGCTLDDFDDVQPADSLLPCERIHIEKLRTLDAHGRDVVTSVLDKEHERMRQLEQKRLEQERIKRERLEQQRMAAQKKDADKPLSEFADDYDDEELVEYKIYNIEAVAGLGNWIYDEDDDNYSMLVFVDDEVPDRAEFGIRIKGKSMEPTIRDNSIVWVEPVIAPCEGEICVVVYDNNSLCKEIHIDRTNREVTLISHNEDYDDIDIDDAELLKIVGRVVLDRNGKPILARPLERA